MLESRSPGKNRLLNKLIKTLFNNKLNKKGSARNLVVCDLLKKAANILEQNAQENSIFLFR